MELHAVWNRIDQLEKLVISQAKEIDALKRLVASQQLQVQNNNNNNPSVPTITSPKAVPTLNFYKTVATSFVSNNNGLLQHQQQQQQQPNKDSSQFAYQPCLLNPLVHPPQAIPPVASRPAVLRESRMQINSGAPNAAAAEEAATNKTPIQNLPNNSLIVAIRTPPASHHHPVRPVSWAQSSPSRNINNGPYQQQHQHQHLATAHHQSPSRQHAIVSPNSVITSTDRLDQTSDDSPNDKDKHVERQSFVEVLTCFCPCFSMC